MLDIDTLTDVANKFTMVSKSLHSSLYILFVELSAVGQTMITNDVAVLGGYRAAQDLAATVRQANLAVREAAGNFGLANLADAINASATCYKKAEENAVGAVNKLAAARHVDTTVGVQRDVPDHPDEMRIQFPLQTGRSAIGNSAVTNPFNNGMPIYDPPFELPNGTGEVEIRQTAGGACEESVPDGFDALYYMVEAMKPRYLWEVAAIYRTMAKVVNDSAAACRAPACQLAEAWGGKVAQVATGAMQAIHRSQAGFVSSVMDIADALEWHGSKQRAWQLALAEINLAGDTVNVPQTMEHIQQQTNETIRAFPDSMPISFGKASQKGYQAAEPDARSLWLG
ncbi:hypothetical protein [Actinoallomurus acaciae]|uniref:Uncharacterized protein n=1 Tax=Actinoallomurus acaciae TaxID=502577 RepID=A0ABV5Y7P5_9ACTN